MKVEVTGEVIMALLLNIKLVCGLECAEIFILLKQLCCWDGIAALYHKIYSDLWNLLSLSLFIFLFFTKWRLNQSIFSLIKIYFYWSVNSFSSVSIDLNRFQISVKQPVCVCVRAPCGLTARYDHSVEWSKLGWTLWIRLHGQENTHNNLMLGSRQKTHTLTMHTDTHFHFHMKCKSHYFWLARKCSHTHTTLPVTSVLISLT